MMVSKIYTNAVASITDLKQGPMDVLESGGGDAVAIFNRSEVAFYCVPVALYHDIVEKLASSSSKSNPETGE